MEGMIGPVLKLLCNMLSAVELWEMITIASLANLLQPGSAEIMPIKQRGLDPYNHTDVKFV